MMKSEENEKWPKFKFLYRYVPAVYIFYKIWLKNIITVKEMVTVKINYIVFVCQNDAERSELFIFALFRSKI